MPDSCSRRAFLRWSVAGLAGAALAPWSAVSARSRPVLTLRLAHLVVRPGSEADATAVREGGAMGADEAAYNADLFGDTVTLTQEIVDTAADARNATDRLTQEADVLVTHVPNPDAFADIVNTAAANDALVLNAGAATPRLRAADCHPRAFHVIPSDAQCADALVAWLASTDAPPRVVGVVEEDGAAETRWAYAEQRLSAAGLTVQRADTPEDAVARAGSNARVWVEARGAVLADALNALADAPAPVLVSAMERAALGRAIGPATWHPALFKYGATQVSDRFAERTGQPMHGLAYVHWAAMQIAADAALQAQGADVGPLRTHLRTQTRFDGRKAAPITFRAWNQQARHELYIVTPSEDGESTVTSPIPVRMPDAPEAQRTALDELGLPANTGCEIQGG